MSHLQPYDAVLLVSFGGPEGPDEVMPFLERVTAGRGIPTERLREVSRHYFDHFDGVSPINAANRRLLADLRAEFERRAWPQPIAWGNRNAAPFLTDAVAELAQRGVRRVAAVLTSAYPSYSSCRQYRENLFDAMVQFPNVQLDVVPPYAHRQSFARAQADSVTTAVQRVSDEEGPHLLFVTHSIPEVMNDNSGPSGGAYRRWHEQLARDLTTEVSHRVGRPLVGEVVYCSRSGPPHMPWLEPDINDRIRELAAAGHRAVVAVPFGFISDHVEVAYDLDIEAAATAQQAGVEFIRAASVGTSPTFIAGLCDALADLAATARQEPVAPDLISAGEFWATCARACCPNARQPQRAALMS